MLCHGVAGECLRLGLADEVRYSILPVLIGEGIAFFGSLGRDAPLHLTEIKAYHKGVVALCYRVRVNVPSVSDSTEIGDPKSAL